MSEAVRAAIAARRAAFKKEQQEQAARARNHSSNEVPTDTASTSSSPSSSSPSTSQLVATRQKSGQNTSSGGSGGNDGNEMGLYQRPEGELLFKSCTSGRLNMSSRMPALQRIPSSVFTLLDGEAPQWYEDLADEASRRPWYEREDLRTFSAANGEIEDVDARLADFRALVRIELQNNRIPGLPVEMFQLVNLTSLNLSRNSLSSVPPCLLALDSLIELDLSHNQITTLWADDDVAHARDSRREWDEDNADEEGGVWAGLIARMGSPTKRARPAPPTVSQRGQPMRSLRHLNLASNRLANASVGLKSGDFTWPPALTDLDLSDNGLRGPFPLSFVGRLKDLSKLSLGGNGISDEVFRQDAERDTVTQPFGPTFFASLTILELHRCDIDDLAKLEAIFGSRRTRFPGDSERIGNKDIPRAVSPAAKGVAAKTLARVTTAANKPEVDVDAQPPALAVVLEGNPLREETFKRKYGMAKSRGQSSASTQSQPAAQAAPAPSAQPSRTAQRASAALTAEAGFARSNLSDPVKNTPSASQIRPQSPSKQPAKEAWETQADAGLLTEGGRRRARAEAARREREALQAQTQQGNDEEGVQGAIHGNGPPSRGQGVNRTGLSDWDGTPAPRRANGEWTD